MWFHNNTYSSFSPTTALGVGSSQVGVDVIFMYIEFIEISHAKGVLVDSEHRVRKGQRAMYRSRATFQTDLVVCSSVS